VLGHLPVGVLEKPSEILRFKAIHRKGREIATVNRALATLRAAINWGRFQDPPYLTTTPFHRFGVNIKVKGIRMLCCTKATIASTSSGCAGRNQNIVSSWCCACSYPAVAPRAQVVDNDRLRRRTRGARISGRSSGTLVVTKDPVFWSTLRPGDVGI